MRTNQTVNRLLKGTPMNEIEIRRLIHKEEPLSAARHNQLKESVMTTIARESHQAHSTPEPVRLQTKRRVIWTAAAAAIVAIAMISFNLGGTTPPAEAAVLDAANATTDAGSLRITMQRFYADGTSDEYSGHVNGADSFQELRYLAADGTERSDTFLLTVVGGTAWYQAPDGTVTEQELGADERLAPFADANESVLAAALASKRIETTQADAQFGATAMKYRIVLDEAGRSALEALGPAVLAWFDLEDPASVHAIDVTVADGFIVEVVLSGGSGVSPTGDTAQRSVTRYSDFGADLPVQPPTS